MALTRASDLTAADWLARPETPWAQTVTFGPAGFAAYARLRFIPDPAEPGQAEADVEVPDDHPSEVAQVRRALRHLAGFTTTPRECFFCVWEGYSDVKVAPGPLVVLPHRRYALFRGTVDDIDGWERDLGGGLPIAPPAFVWPADRAWCLARDVDPHWAGIGAGRAAIDALLADPGLDVVTARPGEAQPSY